MLLLVLAPVTGLADSGGGLTLRDNCRIATKDSDSMSDFDRWKATRCMAYVEGVLDGWILAGGHLCKPEEVSNGEQAAVVAKYLDDHPEELHLHEGILVINAVTHAWPCKK